MFSDLKQGLEFSGGIKRVRLPSGGAPLLSSPRAAKLSFPSPTETKMNEEAGEEE